MFPKLSSVKDRRKKLGITQQELAKSCELSQSLIAKLENSNLDPSYTSAIKIFTVLDSLENRRELKCSDVMKRPVNTVKASEIVEVASKLMKRHQISQIPVIEGGTVSESTILNKLSEGIGHDDLMNMKVGEVMESPLPSAPPESPVSSILPMLRINGAVLIVGSKGILGIITKSDLI